MIFISFIFLFLFENAVFAETLPSQVMSQPLVIGRIDSDESDQFSVVTVRLDRAPTWDKVVLEEHGDFLQIKIPDSIVSQPGQFIDGKGSYLAKIVAYQTEPNQSVVRIFLKSETSSNIIKSSEVEVLDNRIVFTLDHSHFGKKITSEIQEKLIETETVEKPLYALFDDTKILQYLAYFFIAISFLTLLSLTLRRFFRNQDLAFFSKGDSQKIRSIGQLSLSPKQKLSLIQVGEEKFLLSVSYDRVELLTKLEMDRVSSPQQLSKPIPPTVPNIPKKELPPPVAPNKSNHKKINYRIDDRGITHERTDDAIKDVTQIIREKLKALPKI
jgi:flagellar biogenesis protein FliO